MGSTAVAERIDSLVTPDPPPCEIIMHRLPGRPQCGKPSKYKLRRSCECGVKSTRFVCESCYFDLITGTVACNFCLRLITDWTLA